MVQFPLLSVRHLEWGDYDPPPADGHDVVFVAGDIQQSPKPSNRMHRLAETSHSLLEMIGSLDEVQLAGVNYQRWLITPAIGLDHRIPLDLLHTCPGTRMVQTLIDRIDYGVYS
jgi:putative toxin-antitoxin system antitoxin component (TIGR02293 family)